jgi:hypothetical protein
MLVINQQGISAYRRRSQTPIKVTLTQLEREGVVVDGKGIPSARYIYIYTHMYHPMYNIGHSLIQQELDSLL